MSTAVIFGGAGFIGQHFSTFLLSSGQYSKVVLADIAELTLKAPIKEYIENKKIELVQCDVRRPIQLETIDEVALICNFAAIHREPGHNNDEYYHTNLPGAENVCSWATSVGCDRIIFTSSIAPYGPTELQKTELDIPTPVTGYGGSKLVAEKIHEGWQLENKKLRRLVIIRPGVVFGPGEGGNVSRLIKAVKKGYFFYTGNKKTRKAGVYIKELCNSMLWVLQQECNGMTRYNMSMNPGPTIEEYVDVINKVMSTNRKPKSVPYYLLYAISCLVEPIANLLNIQQPISPVRLKKLVKSNNIVPEQLKNMGYTYKFDLEQAMSDWKKDQPNEW